MIFLYLTIWNIHYLNQTSTLLFHHNLEYFPNELLKQQQNEETTKLRLITPTIEAKWPNKDKILMEYKYTAGRISIDEYNVAFHLNERKVIEVETKIAIRNNFFDERGRKRRTKKDITSFEMISFIFYIKIILFINHFISLY